jgi:leader peptidase (prepilin peptidase)/N-methyltransferase
VGEAAGEIAAGLAVAVWLIALSAFDIRQRRLPNVLTLPGAVVILCAAAVTGHGASALAGAAALFGVYAAVHLIAPAAMGAGDVKLAIGVGALAGAFGVQAWLLCAFGASALTGLLGIVAMMRGSRAMLLPHGPSMCVAAAAALVGAAM